MGPSAVSAGPFRSVAGPMTGAVACQGGFTGLGLNGKDRVGASSALQAFSAGWGDSSGEALRVVTIRSGLGVSFRPGLDSARTAWATPGPGEGMGSCLARVGVVAELRAGVVEEVAKTETVISAPARERAGGGISTLGEASTGSGRASGSVEDRAVVPRSWAQAGAARGATGIAPTGAVGGHEFAAPTFVTVSASAEARRWRPWLGAGAAPEAPWGTSGVPA